MLEWAAIEPGRASCRSEAPVIAALGLGLAAVLAGCQPKPKHPGAYQGVIELDERALGFEVGGRVAAIEVERGARVHAGQVLARLDDTLERMTRESREAQANAAEADLALVKAGSRPEDVRSAEAQLRGARANEALLEKNAQRERALLASGAVAQAAVDDAESRLENATAERQALEQRVRELKAGARHQEVESAEARAAAAQRDVGLEAERVGLHELRAPADGIVLDRMVEAGEVVTAGAPVLTVADVAHPYADVFVPEGEIDGIRLGAKVNAAIDATAQTFSGSVENIARKTEFTPRYLFSDRERPNLVVRVRVRLDDPNERLHAGLPTFVTIDRTLVARGPSASNH